MNTINSSLLKGAASVLIGGALLVIVGSAAHAAPVALKGALTASIVPIGDISKSEAREVAQIRVKGGVAGAKVSPFKYGLRLVYEIHDPLVTAEYLTPELYQTYITHGGATTKVSNTSPFITDLGGGFYEVLYSLSTEAAAYIASGPAGVHTYSVRYQSQYLPSGQPVTIHLVNGVAPYAPNKYSHFTASDGVDRLRTLEGYQMTYDTSALAALAVVVPGSAYQAERNAILTDYGITVPDADRTPLAGVKLIRNTLDSVGRAVLPKNLTALRINRGYTDASVEGSVGIVPYSGSNEAGFTTVLMHELHHAIDSHSNRCGQLNPSICKYLTTAGTLTAEGKTLADVSTRAARIRAVAQADARSYLRTAVTLERYSGTGTIDAAPGGVVDTWKVTLKPQDLDNAVYRTQAMLRFTSGALSGQELVAARYVKPTATLSVRNAKTKFVPSVGDTFTLVGDGADFFVIFPQEFLASISNDWNADTRTTWKRCQSAYAIGRSLVMDQCLLFADLHSFGKSTMTVFKQNSNGTFTTSQTPVVKEGGRVVAVPELGPERFVFGADGLTQGPPGLLGDANLDGKVTASDALLVLRSAVGSVVTTNLKNTDADCSGEVDATDALIVLKMAVGSIPVPTTCAKVQTLQLPEITVTKTGTGAGSVEPTLLTITGAETTFGFKATAAAGSVFAGWSGPCTGSGDCQFTTSGLTPITLTARFDSLGLAAAALLALGSLGVDMSLLLVFEVLFFLGFGVHYFYPSRRLALALAVVAVLTGILMLYVGVIG